MKTTNLRTLYAEIKNKYNKIKRMKIVSNNLENELYVLYAKYKGYGGKRKIPALDNDFTYYLSLAILLTRGVIENEDKRYFDIAIRNQLYFMHREWKDLGINAHLTIDTASTPSRLFGELSCSETGRTRNILLQQNCVRCEEGDISEAHKIWLIKLAYATYMLKSSTVIELYKFAEYVDA